MASTGSRKAPPGWRVVKTIPTNIQDVDAAGPGNAWVVGGTRDWPGRAVMHHWNGRSWQQVTLPPTVTRFGWLRGVSARSPRNILVGGSETAGWPLARWDGTRWHVHRWPSESYDIPVVLGPKDMWGFGWKRTSPHGGIAIARHFDGTRWQRVNVPSEYAFDAVTALSHRDIWAVGSDINGSAVLMHWNGTRWSIADEAPPGTGDRDIVAMKRNEVWLFGLSNVQGHPRANAARWNGSRWQYVTLPGRYPESAAADGRGGIWVGARSGDMQSSFLLHYSGGTWTRVELPRSVRRSARINSLANIPGTTSMWAILGRSPSVPNDHILKFGR